MDIIETTDNGILTVAVKGRLDAASADTAKQKLSALIDGGARQIILDFSELDYVSSIGLRVLLLIAKQVAKQQGKIALYSPVDHITEVFQLSGFDSLISIFADRARAAQHVSEA